MGKTPESKENALRSLKSFKEALEELMVYIDNNDAESINCMLSGDVELLEINGQSVFLSVGIRPRVELVFSEEDGFFELCL